MFLKHAIAINAEFAACQGECRRPHSSSESISGKIALPFHEGRQHPTHAMDAFIIQV